MTGLKTIALAGALALSLGVTAFAQSGGGGGGSAGSSGGGAAGSSSGATGGSSLGTSAPPGAGASNPAANPPATGGGATTGTGNSPTLGTTNAPPGAGGSNPAANPPAAGVAPANPATQSGQGQSNTNLQRDTGANATSGGSPANLRPSTGTLGNNPSVSGSRTDAANADRCRQVLADRQSQPKDLVATCERDSMRDAAAARERSLNSANDKAVNSICRGC